MPDEKDAEAAAEAAPPPVPYEWKAVLCTLEAAEDIEIGPVKDYVCGELGGNVMKSMDMQAVIDVAVAAKEPDESPAGTKINEAKAAAAAMDPPEEFVMTPEMVAMCVAEEIARDKQASYDATMAAREAKAAECEEAFTAAQTATAEAKAKRDECKAKEKEIIANADPDGKDDDAKEAAVAATKEALKEYRECEKAQARAAEAKAAAAAELVAPMLCTMIYWAGGFGETAEQLAQLAAQDGAPLRAHLWVHKAPAPLPPPTEGEDEKDAAEEATPPPPVPPIAAELQEKQPEAKWNDPIRLISLLDVEVPLPPPPDPDAPPPDPKAKPDPSLPVPPPFAAPEVIDAAKSVLATLMSYDKWLAESNIVDVPEASEEVDLRYYDKLLESLPEVEASVSVVLHCVLEQCARNCAEDEVVEEADEEETALAAVSLLDSAFELFKDEYEAPAAEEDTGLVMLPEGDLTSKAPFLSTAEKAAFGASLAPDSGDLAAPLDVAAIEERMRSLLPTPGVGRLYLPEEPGLKEEEVGVLRTELASMLPPEVAAPQLERYRLLKLAAAALPEGAAAAHGAELVKWRHLAPLVPEVLPRTLLEACDFAPDKAYSYDAMTDSLVVATFASDTKRTFKDAVPALWPFAEYMSAVYATGKEPTMPEKVYTVEASMAEVSEIERFVFPPDGAMVSTTLKGKGCKMGGRKITLRKDGLLAGLRSLPGEEAPGRFVCVLPDGTVIVATVEGGGPPEGPTEELAEEMPKIAEGEPGAEEAAAAEGEGKEGEGEGKGGEGEGEGAPEAESPPPPPPPPPPLVTRVQVTGPDGRTAEMLSTGAVLLARSRGAVGEGSLPGPEACRAVLPSGSVVKYLASGSTMVLHTDGNVSARYDEGEYEEGKASGPRWEGVNLKGECWAQQDIPPPPPPPPPPEPVEGEEPPPDDKDKDAEAGEEPAEPEPEPEGPPMPPAPVALPPVPTVTVTDPETRAEVTTREDLVQVVRYEDGQVLVQHNDGTRITVRSAGGPWRAECEGLDAVQGNGEGMTVSLWNGMAMQWSSETGVITLASRDQSVLCAVEGSVRFAPSGLVDPLAAAVEGLAGAYSFDLRAFTLSMASPGGDGLVGGDSFVAHGDGKVSLKGAFKGESADAMSEMRSVMSFAQNSSSAPPPPPAEEPLAAEASAGEAAPAAEASGGEVPSAEVSGEVGGAAPAEEGGEEEALPEDAEAAAEAEAAAAGEAGEEAPAAGPSSGPAAPAGDEPIPATPVAKHYVPRVFVIRPGGEGYEFLSEAAFERYLAAREGDPQCTVTREEVQAAGDSEAEKNTFSYIFLQKETLPQVALPALPISNAIPARPSSALPSLRALKLPSRTDWGVEQPEGLALPRITARAPESEPPAPPPAFSFAKLVAYPEMEDEVYDAANAVLVAHEEWAAKAAEVTPETYQVADERPPEERAAEEDVMARILAARADAEVVLEAKLEAEREAAAADAHAKEEAEMKAAAEAPVPRVAAEEEWTPAPPKVAAIRGEPRPVGGTMRYFESEEGLLALESTAGLAKTLPEPDTHGEPPAVAAAAPAAEASEEAADPAPAPAAPAPAAPPPPPAVMPPAYDGAEDEEEMPSPAEGYDEGYDDAGDPMSTERSGALANTMTRDYDATRYTVLGEERTEPLPGLPKFISQPPAPYSINQRFLEVEDPVRGKVRTTSANHLRMRGADLRQFELVPAEIDFGTVARGRPVTVAAELLNVSADIGRYSLRPPHPRFHVEPRSTGFVPSGLSAVIDITFKADQVGTFVGKVQVKTEINTLEVSVAAQCVEAGEAEEAAGPGGAAGGGGEDWVLDEHAGVDEAKARAESLEA